MNLILTLTCALYVLGILARTQGRKRLNVLISSTLTSCIAQCAQECLKRCLGLVP